jgi:hypothetical protein
VADVQTFFTYRQGLGYEVLEVTFPAGWLQPKNGTWFKSLEGFMVPWHGFYETREQAEEARRRARVGHILGALKCRATDEVGKRLVDELAELVKDQTLEPLIEAARARLEASQQAVNQ